MAAGTTAYYDASTKTVTCTSCIDQTELSDKTAQSMETRDRVPTAVAEPLRGEAEAPPVAAEAAEAPVDSGDGEAPAAVVGTAGASARRKYERLHRKREAEIRSAHPRIGGLILALSDDPQSTRAWATGARGEERLAGRLDAVAGETLRLLHDRRIPRTRANIDHIAVAATGVYVVDAKRYAGQPDLRVEGGLLRPRTEKLVVGRRDCTKLVDGVLGQVDVVRAALAADHPDLPVHGVLCLVEADWPLIGGDFVTRGVQVVWPKKLQKRLVADGPISHETIVLVHGMLATQLPAA